MRNMSFALTSDQIIAETKTVTRRLGWIFLKEGDLLRPVTKCMGLRKGETVSVLRGSPIRVTSVRREALRRMLVDRDYGLIECQREGFGGHAELKWPSAFVDFFCRTHRGCTPETIITRIEFVYE